MSFTSINIDWAMRQQYLEVLLYFPYSLPTTYSEKNRILRERLGYSSKPYWATQFGLLPMYTMWWYQRVTYCIL